MMGGSVRQQQREDFNACCTGCDPQGTGDRKTIGACIEANCSGMLEPGYVPTRRGVELENQGLDWDNPANTGYRGARGRPKIGAAGYGVDDLTEVH